MKILHWMLQCMAVSSIRWPGVNSLEYQKNIGAEPISIT